VTPGDEHDQARVLAIDDSRWIHRLLETRLRSEPLTLHGAMTGRQGLAAARTLLPDVILLDLDLPDITGFEIIQALKSDAPTRDIPILVLSSATELHSKIRAFDLGAIDFVNKPFDVAELQVRIRSAARLRKLIRMLAQRAQLDGLTGLWNRAHFDQRLREEIARATRHKRDLALILCDLDRFKNLNDQFGHPAGDRVLESFATLLKTGRTGDVACRYGGEEFAIILPSTSADDGAIVAERIRQRLLEHDWHVGENLRVTASFGVTDLRRTGAPDPAALLESADQALYAAKGAGRDGVRVAPLRAATHRRPA
jgi:diguanylate cyclase (GGDEF)-like protein